MGKTHNYKYNDRNVKRSGYYELRKKDEERRRKQYAANNDEVCRLFLKRIQASRFSDCVGRCVEV